MVPEISVVVPAYDEVDNIEPLVSELVSVLNQFGRPFEVIIVDDGSSDGTAERVLALRNRFKQLRLVQMRRNFGQTSAMDAGFKLAQGRVVVPMDADMQNDPHDIPKMLAELDKGFDVVCAWRKHRKDSLSKKVFSRIANVLRRVLVSDTVHDSGATLKVIRKEAVEGLDLYGEMHRYIPALVRMRGFRVTEVVANHRQRHKGRTKYNLRRVLRGFLDLLVVAFWMKYASRPIQLFGPLGVASTGLGVLAGLYLLYEKFVLGASLANRPMLLLAILLVVLGVQFILFGFLADLLAKIIYRGNPPYSVKRVV